MLLKEQLEVLQERVPLPLGDGWNEDDVSEVGDFLRLAGADSNQGKLGFPVCADSLPFECFRDPVGLLKEERPISEPLRVKVGGQLLAGAFGANLKELPFRVGESVRVACAAPAFAGIGSRQRRIDMIRAEDVGSP